MKSRILLLSLYLLAMLSASGQFTLATDNAGNYSGTWANGNNYGSGFNAWSNTYGANTGTFIGNPSNDGMGTTGIGTTAFGLFATGSGYLNANRQMTEGMQFNDKFSFYWAMNWDANSGNKGFDIKAGGNTVFNINNNGGSATITSTNGTADNTYGTNPMLVEIVRTGDNSYSFSMTRRSSGTYTTTFTSSTAINEIGIYIGNQNNGSGNRNLYFNHFQVTNDGNFNVSSGSTTYSKSLTGAGALSKSGAGTLTLTGANSYSGGTTVNNGTLQLNRTGGATLASTGTVTVNSGGTLRVSSNQTLSNLTIEAGGSLIVDSGVTLTINGILVINENVTLDGNLTIGSGGAATIAVNKALTVSGALTIKSDATGTGSLIHSSSGVSATVERYVVGHGNVATDGWHLMGSPVATFNIAGSSFEPGSSDDLYGWSEATNTWMNYKAGNPTQIVPGTGYLVAYENTATKTFSGNLNVSDVSVSGLSHNASQGKGWHLLGNPFASALEWNKTGGSWALSNIAPTAKVWNSGSKAYNDIAANGIIPAAQGFFVQVNESTTGSLTIPASARTHSSTAWYKSTTPRILLSASPADGSSKQESQIRIEPEATAGFDFYHDSRFLEGYAPKFYSVAGGEMLSTNAMPQVQNGTSIPFGFVKNQHSSFVIRLEESLPGEIIQLKDLKLNLTHNLSQHPEYLFSAAEGDDPNRFLLVFGTVGINEKPGTQTTLQATMHNGQLWVNNPAENSQLSIHDLSGRMLQQMRLSASGLQQLGTNLKKGAYIIRLQGGEQTLSTKVINR